MRKEKLPPTQSEQEALTFDEVLTDLMDGNRRFVSGSLSDPNVVPRREVSVAGQYPKAYILSCVDSRVPVEQVFDQGIGDIFVGRVAGNVENEDQLGSMEFASQVAGVKLVMVLGHESCGAVKGACDGVELGNLTGLLDKIRPSVEAVEGFEEGERNSQNSRFVSRVVEANVRTTVEEITERSSVLSERKSQGQLAIVGAVYSLESGEVRLLDIP